MNKNTKAVIDMLERHILEIKHLVNSAYGEGIPLNADETSELHGIRNKMKALRRNMQNRVSSIEPRRITEAQAKTYFHNALCNGLSQLHSYGIMLDTTYFQDAYETARTQLVEAGENPRSVEYEAVLMRILENGEEIAFADVEGDEDAVVSLETVYERMKLVPIEFLTAMESEQDDADDADAILQTVLYGKIIFG